MTGRPFRHELGLSVFPGRLAICRLERDVPIPEWAPQGGFVSITRTEEELSIVCPEEHVDPRFPCEVGWRRLGIEGPFAFSEVGILASVVDPLAEAGITVFVTCTFDTDYVLVKEADLERATAALARAGHRLDARP